MCNTNKRVTKKQKQSIKNELWLLCSGDKPLINLVRSFPSSFDSNEEAILQVRSIMTDLWRGQDGSKILDYLLNHQSRETHQERKANHEGFNPYNPAILKQLEEVLKQN